MTEHHSLTPPLGGSSISHFSRSYREQGFILGRLLAATSTHVQGVIIELNARH